MLIREKNWQSCIDKIWVLRYNDIMGYESVFAKENRSERGFMTQEIIKSIKQAEAEAAQRKQAALLQAEAHIKAAQDEAVKEQETMEQVCSAYKVSQMKDAEKAAQEKYLAAVEKQREDSATQCSKILEDSEAFVSLIVGRVIGGNR